jgi:regulator of RNase E activity RraB
MFLSKFKLKNSKNQRGGKNMGKERCGFCAECRELTQYEFKKVVRKCIIKEKVYDMEITVAFCKNLKTLTIPSTTTYIGWGAFFECSSLTEIKFDGTVEQWNAVTKGDNWNYGVPATKVICDDGEVTLD